jgi:glycogen debranching enzyme
VLLDNLVLKHNELYLVGEREADASGERANGLYLRDTRFLDCWDLWLDGLPPEPLESRQLGSDRAIVVGANKAIVVETDEGARTLLPLTVAIEQHVQLLRDLQIRIVLTNYNPAPAPLTLSLEIGADFRDLFDIRGFERQLRGGEYLDPVHLVDGITLAYADRAGAVSRLVVHFSRTPSLLVASVQQSMPQPNDTVLLPGFDRLAAPELLPAPPRAKAFFHLVLEHGASWEMQVVATPVSPDEHAAPLSGPNWLAGERDRMARIATDHPWVNRVLARAADDLTMLQTSFREGALPAAGIPWFVAPFGRDSLIASLQTLYAAPWRAVGTLRTLASLQGKVVDPAREEEPGKILHEMRYGEMARLGEVPHTPYYGTIDATPLFVMLFAETVRWIGDDGLYDELLPNVKRALDWIEHWGDRDGDGLVEYASQPIGGGRIVHQGWKDSHDSLHGLAGEAVFGAIALVEVQGYVYAAYARLADVVERHGEPAWAAALRARAERVREVVEARFWLPDEGYYAQALDGDKRPVAAISSNPGHLLYCGLPSPEHGRAVASRLRQRDLDSGWGVRTLAVGMPTFNPMSYHNGSVWPHDNSLIAAGLRRYGEIGGMERIASALFAAAERNCSHRLPELYCGFQRDEEAASDAPVPYPVSCAPQAWAASSPLLLIRAMLGLTVDPGRRAVRVAPALPSWLGRIRIEGLEALGRRFDLEVARQGKGYRIESDGPIEPGKRAILATLSRRGE